MKSILNELLGAFIVLVCSIIRIVSLFFSGIAWVFTKCSELLGIAIEKLTTVAQRKLGKYEA